MHNKCTAKQAVRCVAYLLYRQHLAESGAEHQALRHPLQGVAMRRQTFAEQQLCWPVLQPDSQQLQCTRQVWSAVLWVLHL